jgi:hypothetical protein
MHGYKSGAMNGTETSSPSGLNPSLPGEGSAARILLLHLFLSSVSSFFSLKRKETKRQKRQENEKGKKVLFQIGLNVSIIDLLGCTAVTKITAEEVSPSPPVEFEPRDC